MSEKLSFRTNMDFTYGEPKEMAEGVARIVANNPGPFTFKGTNTYLIGTRELAIVDPGPGGQTHLDAVMKAVAGRPVTHIILTHTHHDHFDGLAEMVAATGAKTAGHGRRVAEPGRIRRSSSGAEHVDLDFIPDIALKHGDTLEAGGRTITALHTPGHAPDHLALALDGDDGVVLSGDHVMGWNTSVVAPPEGRMLDYMRSLELLMARAGDKIYLPGHGDRIESPQRWVKAFIIHRNAREMAILDAIKSGEQTIRKIVSVVYRGLDARLVDAACLSVQAHVEHLLDRGLVRLEGQLRSDHALSAA
jgi:glyoxylase-like metal-dependent hydrolase (beta-lactamase superfamily II)